tara:strand:+ start:694 stop:1467 length:774 start_codon:yes stop_codon:yes gene_type:complete
MNKFNNLRNILSRRLFDLMNLKSNDFSSVSLSKDNIIMTAIISVYEGDYKKIEKECSKLGIEVVLYNKKNNKFGLPVKNIGVDAYDKFHYIINNYENLPDIILFSTDSMFSTPKKIKKIKFILDYIDILKNRSGFLTGHIFKIPENEVNFTLDKRYETPIIPSTIRPFEKWFNHFINKDINVKDIFVCKKSTFAVTKDLVLKLPKETYKEFLSEIERHSVNGHDSEVPHYFEMAYVELFCKNDKTLMFHDFKNYGAI